MDTATSGDALEQLAREQAALRRVATLVARQPSPQEHRIATFAELVSYAIENAETRRR